MKLLKKCGGSNADLQVADGLGMVPAEQVGEERRGQKKEKGQVGLVVDENDLEMATKRICNYLEQYWLALHPPTKLMEDIYLRRYS